MYITHVWKGKITISLPIRKPESYLGHNEGRQIHIPFGCARVCVYIHAKINTPTHIIREKNGRKITQMLIMFFSGYYNYR